MYLLGAFILESDWIQQYLYMMISKKYILVFIAISTVCSIVAARQTLDNNSPLILITEDNHEAVSSLNDIKQIAKNLPRIKGISIDTDNIQGLIYQLKDVVKGLKIKKQQMSSLVIDKLELSKLTNISFQDADNLQTIKKILQEQGQNILIHVRQTQKMKRLLEHDSESNLIAPKGQKSSISPLFRNMSPVALTGLLVSLFLAIILLIAINCLYQVKTNDKFGRTNLWVGKQS